MVYSSYFLIYNQAVLKRIISILKVLLTINQMVVNRVSDRFGIILNIGNVLSFNDAKPFG